MMKNNKYLLKTLKHAWQASPKTFLALLGVSLTYAAIKFLEIKLFQALIEGVHLVYKGQGLKEVWPVLLGFSLVFFASPLLELVEFLVKGYFWRRGHGHLQGLFHDRVSQESLIDFEDKVTLDQIKKASLGSSESPNNIRILLQSIFMYLPYFLLVAYYLWTIEPVLLIMLLFISLPLLLAELYNMKDQHAFENQVANMRRYIDYYEACLIHKDYHQDTLQNGAYPYFSNKLVLAINDYLDKHKATYMRVFRRDSVMEGLNVIGYLGVLGLLVYLLGQGRISVGEFAGIYYAIDKLTHMIRAWIGDLATVMEEMARSVFLLDYLARGQLKDGQVVDLTDKAGDICLEGVSFTYPNSQEEALKDISLSLPAHTTLAIVGENGSGKTTLSKIILGLYQPQGGQVTYGGQVLCPTPSYDHVSAVFQDYCKYQLSLEDNIRISQHDSLTSLDSAISKSHLKVEGLETAHILSPAFGGRDLSGGQWQRLAIARGLYKDHQVIVLDEPTAAIDPIEEELVFKAFRQASHRKTAIMVTHRLGSVQFADQIVVLDQGRLVEVGSHQSLMDQRGKYYELFNHQSKWYKR